MILHSLKPISPQMYLENFGNWRKYWMMLAHSVICKDVSPITLNRHVTLKFIGTLLFLYICYKHWVVYNQDVKNE